MLRILSPHRIDQFHLLDRSLPAANAVYHSQAELLKQLLFFAADDANLPNLKAKQMQPIFYTKIYMYQVSSIIILVQYVIFSSFKVQSISLPCHFDSYVGPSLIYIH